MTDILCNWLNDEVTVSRKIDTANFAKEFSTGYLIGEVLQRYQLQNDFDQFSQSRTADSKLNNFTRLEPVLHLLGIPFDTNIARDIMTEKHGVATRLMYQLFIALNKKVKNNLTGVAMETMRPAAPVKLEGVESDMYKERLKNMTPRQTDLNLDALVARFHQKQIEMEQTAFKERFEEEERHNQELQNERQGLIRRYKENQARKSEMLAKIKAATVHIPKPPPNRTAKAISMRREARKIQEAEDAKQDIEIFEERMKRTLPPSKPLSEDVDQDQKEVAALPDSLDLIKPASNGDYINKIRKRLNEDASARAEREKRRRKVLVDQLKAHEAQEEARREEMLVNRLMRQSQQERRIAVQLLQARHEKEVICRNRLKREAQYEASRLKEFEEALNREAEMARLAKIEYEEQTHRDQELHDKIAAERAEARYKKHYDMCNDVLMNMVDFSTKIGEYRELTNRLLPAKLMREWTALFVAGKPLYEEPAEGASDEEPTAEQVLEEDRQKLIDEGDFNEYRNMIGEWQPPEGCDLTGPPRDNPIVGHIVQRLFGMVYPPAPPSPPPEFPPFPIKACVLGKVFSGKSTTLKKLAQYHRLKVLCADDLVAEAIEAFKSKELEEGAETAEEEPGSGTSTPKPETPANKGEADSTARVASASEATLDNKQQEEAAEAAGAASASPGGAAVASAGHTAPPSAAPSASASRAQVDEGAEKTDPEKPVDDDEEEGSVTADSMMSPRARLGAKVVRNMKKGETVDDQLTVDIIVEAIKRIPEGTGWILDGFPATYNQAKILEKALSGFDAMSREGTAVGSKSKKSLLAPNPRPPPPKPEPSSGINVVVLFDLEDDLCLRRSAGRTYASQSDEQYQQEFKPPPDGSATGINQQEKVVPVEDPAHDQEQIQHRLTAFADSWPKLEKWFSKFGSLKSVDASQAQETVFLEVEKILEDTSNRLQGKDMEESTVLESTEDKPEETKPPEEEKKTPEPAPPAEVPPAEDQNRSRPGSKKGSRSGSAKRSGSRPSSRDGKDKGGKSKSPGRSASKSDTGKKSAKGSRGSSPKSPKRGRSGKKGKSPEPEPEPTPEAPPGTPPPQPGSDAWEYVDQPIDEELAGILAPQWEGVENTYIGNSKVVFRTVRQERENIIRYFYQIKQDFQAYLRRPDHKQEFVSQWQKEYNEIPDDIREDEETHGELHQRVDDLRERLWSICDERKEQAETECGNIINDGWLEDHLGLLSNQYITLMQAEVDRYQDTVHMLKDYYKGMDGKIPDELQGEFARIPLIELPVEEIERPESAAKSAGSEAASGAEEAPPGDQPGSPTAGGASGEDVKSSTSMKSATPTGKKKKGADGAESPAGEQSAAEAVEEKKPRIPLVPRRPVSPDPNAAAAKGGKQDKNKGKKEGGKPDGSETPPPPTDPDDKLVFDAHQAGIAAIDRIYAAEQAVREAEEEAEREREREKEREKEKAAAAQKKGGKGGKKGGGKSRSPSPKKGKGKDSPSATTPPPPSDEESEEEKEKRMKRERGKQEFFAAIEEEANASKTRLELVKAVAMAVLQDLKGKGDNAYKDMEDWLGARFLKEMESIDQMSEVMRNAIESSVRIKEELVIDQEDFLIHGGVKVLKTPTPPPRPPPMEQVTSETFTIDQIINIYGQFALTAPDGMLSVKAFQETFVDLTSLTHGTEQLPDAWMNMSPEKLEMMALQLSPDQEYINWRSFLIQAAQPWPVPTQADLLDTLQRFQEMDQRSTNYVTREQYDRVDLWFDCGGKPPTPVDISDPYPYDRLSNFKLALFDLFADHSMEPPQLDYVNMLLYFAMAMDPYEGFLRALSVAAGNHMPRLARKFSMKKLSRPASSASLLATLDADGEQEEDVTQVGEDIPESSQQAKVPLDALDRVLHHGQSMHGDSHRFSVTADPEDACSRERLAGIYQELGGDDQEAVQFSILIEHPIIQDMVSSLHTYKMADLKAILSSPAGDIGDVQSVKTAE